MVTAASGRIGQIVTNPEEADFFWVPHALHAHKTDPPYVAQVLVPFLEYIAFELPHYNKSKGRSQAGLYNPPIPQCREFICRAPGWW